MAYFRNRFRDPLALLATYEWEINHSTEEANEKRRNIERTAPTGDGGFVRQQGEASPRILKYAGVILTMTQKTAMDAYYAACDRSTVFFRDVDGGELEVIITGFNATRFGVAWNQRDTVNMRHHIYRYTIEMEVIA